MARSVAQKDWYEIIAPDIFDNEKVSETPSDKKEKVDGRTIKVNLKDLVPTSNKYYMDVFLKVNEVEGNKAQTELVGHKTSKEYVSKMVKRRSDRIDKVMDVDMKDGKKVRIKIIASTLNNTHTSTKKAIKEKIDEIIQDEASSSTYVEFMNDIFQNQIQRNLNDSCKKIYPLRSIEFRKTELLEN